MISDKLGKKAEKKIREWLNRPLELNSYFWRLPDQTYGVSGPDGSNPCDFFLFKNSKFYLIESKATTHDRFEFSMITPYQYDSLLKASAKENVYGIIIVLFAMQQRAFILDIREIDKMKKQGKMSLNITKISKWPIKYSEIDTVPSRKELLDYTGDIEDHFKED